MRVRCDNADYGNDGDNAHDDGDDVEDAGNDSDSDVADCDDDDEHANDEVNVDDKAEGTDDDDDDKEDNNKTGGVSRKLYETRVAASYVRFLIRVANVRRDRTTCVWGRCSGELPNTSSICEETCNELVHCAYYD